MKRNAVDDMLHVVGWEKWQSYRSDRGQPPWIKVHRRLLRNRVWIVLNDEKRGKLLAIWLLAADHDGTIPNDPEIVARWCCMNTPPDLGEFIELGLLEKFDARVASRVRRAVSRREASRRQSDDNPTKSRRQHDVPEAEVKKLKKNSAHARVNTRASIGRPEAPAGVPTAPDSGNNAPTLQPRSGESFSSYFSKIEIPTGMSAVEFLRDNEKRMTPEQVDQVLASVQTERRGK